jgi:hypothetical protein
VRGSFHARIHPLTPDPSPPEYRGRGEEIRVERYCPPPQSGRRRDRALRRFRALVETICVELPLEQRVAQVIQPAAAAFRLAVDRDHLLVRLQRVQRISVVMQVWTGPIVLQHSY